ncbi:precorrin-6y C5,15-methyltransferase (decarboxylating) subunit CbiE [uncultured Neptuniibacter sp.]|uniref:precorrin-6y C5,15-methyltransferase (decarboxylating) subunit CbiE n=1 Tax=uncultured Neptuniibacter sp. TaxID=502143 RepID=UPI00262A6E4A|nr:precorrin-6y C5,15-methyltransferase (decarboxylating) subunit CbiE [uncultured Neptuniibacter sp.]
MIHVVGLGVSHTAELSSEAQRALQQVDLVIGSARQLTTIEALLPIGKTTVELPKLVELKPLIDDVLAEQKSVMILASGDPLFYGIGRWFSRHFAQSDLRFYPAVSSLQTACHRLGIALQDLEVLSLHGRPLAKLKTRLRQNQPLLILTDSQSYPQAIAKLCVDSGFPHARLTVLETLGYPQEQIRTFTADARVLDNCEFDPLHLTLVEPGLNLGYLPEFPGIPDQHFITDADKPGKGMISKREVRLSILSLMQVNAEDRVWDIGAGCGGVAVELAYWQPLASVDAIEHHPERLACLTANRERFGVVSNLNIVTGRAPTVLAGLALPNKVFIGGSGGELPQLLAQVWALLPDKGVLVASAVTENSKQILMDFWQLRADAGDSQQETTQVAVSRGETLAGQLMYRPNLPVNLFKFTKTMTATTAGGGQ